MTDVDKVTCPHCGWEVSYMAINRHKRACGRVPSAAQLEAAFLTNPHLTWRDMEKRYDTQRIVMQRKLWMVGIDTTEFDERVSSHKQRAQRRKEEQDVSYVQCQVCSILIPRADNKRVCNDCMAQYERQNRIKGLGGGWESYADTLEREYQRVKRLRRTT